MAITVTNNYTMTLVDNSVIAHPSTNIIITLPPVEDCSGRVYRVSRLWETDDTDYSVTVNDSLGSTEYTFTASVSSRNTGVNFTSDGINWTVSSTPSIVTGSQSFVGSSDGQYLFDTISENGTLSLPVVTSDMVTANRRVYVSNYNGDGTVTINRTSSDTIDYSDESWVTQSNQTSLVLAAGVTRLLYAKELGKWYDSRLNIELITQSGALSLAGYTKTVFLITPDGSSITLPDASELFGNTTRGNQITISNNSSSSMTVTRNNTDVFYDTNSGVTTKTGTSKVIAGYTSVTFIAISDDIWVTSTYNANDEVTSWDGVTPSTINSSWDNIFYTGASLTKELPSTSTNPTNTIQIVNNGSVTLTITPPTGKKLFISSGYVSSTDILQNRSATFIYSPSIDAWVKG